MKKLLLMLLLVAPMTAFVAGCGEKQRVEEAAPAPTEAENQENEAAAAVPGE